MELWVKKTQTKKKNRKCADSISYIFLFGLLQIMNKLTPELFKLYVKMPSDPEFNLASTLSLALHSSRKNCPKKNVLRSTALSTPKFMKKSNEKQVEVST